MPAMLRHRSVSNADGSDVPRLSGRCPQAPKRHERQVRRTGRRRHEINAVARFRPPAFKTAGGRWCPMLHGHLLRFRSFVMAPRANWKGFLRLSLVTCPVALYPATSDTEKVSLQPDQPQDRPPHQIRQGRRRHRRGGRQRGHHQGLQGRHRHLHRGDEGRAREHRAGIDPHHRDRRVRRRAAKSTAAM